MSASDDDRHNEQQAAASAVERYTRGPAEKQPEADAPEERVGPSYDRETLSRGPALSLNLQLKNGNALAVEYAHRVETRFDPESGIEMFFSTGLKVTVKGVHLNQLYEDLAQHRVLRIRGRDELHAFSKTPQLHGRPLPVVSEIVIERGRLDVDSGLWKAAAGTWSTDRQMWLPQSPGLLN